MEALKKAGYQYIPTGSDREADLVLRQVKDSSKGFEWKGQEDYDRLGDAVTEYLYDMLTEKYKFDRHDVSEDNKDDEDYTSIPVFTKNLNAEVIIYLIQGSGAVTAGMWARSLCINESLHEGTIYPYVKAALDRNWGVVVCNPNIEAAGSECSEYHTLKVFNTFIKKAPAKEIVWVAHSYGGWSSMYCLRHFTTSDMDRIKCMAFTDSVHSLKNKKLSEAQIAKTKNPKHTREVLKWKLQLIPETFDDPSDEILMFLKTKACNWVQSKLPLDTKIGLHDGVHCLSAGHKDHVWTSGTAFPGVFKFIDSFFPPPAPAAASSSSSSDSDISTKIATAVQIKEQGNDLLRDGKFKAACFEYKKAKIYLKGVIDDGEGGDEMMKMASNIMKKSGKDTQATSEQKKDAQDAFVCISSNLSQAKLKLEDYKSVMDATSDVLRFDPDNIKALYRRGIAALRLGLLDESKDALTKVEESDPKCVRTLMQELNQAFKKVRDKEKKAYSQMFK